jgi:dissimilatory sulfite reductase (desulfoviridin) alpha/beta subunit
MNWTPEADAAIKKVPFFVRKKVRQRVETEARSAGRTRVSLADVKAAQKRYLNRMSSEIKGYQLDACFGPSGCPNRAVRADTLVEKIEARLASADLLSFLKQQVGDRLKFHHEFRVTVAECPNACSQPQIKDLGIIGAQLPVVTPESCSGCGECITVCPDGAITMSAPDRPEIDGDQCMHCGKCIAVCPTGTLAKKRRGYRVLLGGKLGRHPRLAEPLPGIYAEDEVLQILETCLEVYKSRSRNGKRFAEILTAADVQRLARKFCKTLDQAEGEGLS